MDAPKATTPPVRRTSLVLSRRVVAPFSTRYSRKRCTIRLHAVIFYLKIKKSTTSRDRVGELTVMPRIRNALGLDSIPAPSILCKTFDRLEMAVWRVLLNVSLADLSLNEVASIDASGVERAHALSH